MNIWLVTIGEPLPLTPDVRLHRTGMLCEVLHQRGHRLTWWTSAFDHNQKKMITEQDREVAVADNFVLKLVKGPGYKRNVSLKRFLDHFYLSQKLKRYFRNEPLRPDIIITSIPCYHISRQAVRFARKNSIPVITDLRDLWPDIFPMVFKSAMMRNFVSLCLTFDYLVLKYCFRNASALVAISETYLLLSARRGNRRISEADRYFLLGMKPRPITERSRRLDTVLPMIRNKKLIAFAGTFGVTYELDLVAEAAKKLREPYPDLVFLMIGTGAQQAFLESEAVISGNIVLTGWLAPDEIKILLKDALAGLMPYKVFATQSIPNKFFDYMEAELPVISSVNNSDMIKLLDEYRLGLHYNAGDLNSFIGVCKKFIEDAAMAAEFSLNAKKFFGKFGNAEVIYLDYAKHIEKVADACRPS